jgi:hypothetical protein
MKKIKSNLQTAILTSKICVSSSVSSLDPSNYFSIFGVRQSLFSVINPILFKHSLKTSFLLIESFIRNKFKFVIITNIKNSILFLKFYNICKKNKIFLLKDSETSAGFLTNKVIKNTVIITLFLDARKTELIQNECLRVKIPLISFSDLTANKFSSSVFVCGNFNSFLAQNLILTLLSICFEQKYSGNTYKNDKS